MSTTQEVLDKLFSKHIIDLPSSGESVKIKKVTIRTLKPVVALLSSVLADLKLTGESLPELNVAGSPDVILSLITKHYDEVAAIVPLLAEIALDKVFDLDPADGLTLVQGIILLNQDFFTKTVLPALDLTRVARANPVEP